MSTEPGDYRKLFTVAEANAALTYVRAIVRDLVRLTKEVIERRERLSGLLAGRDEDDTDIYSQELDQVKEELDKDGRQLHEYLDEIRQIGAVPQNGAEGLVDFPSLKDGRVVFLCWRLGEPEIQHWHEVDAGFIGRQPLVADSVGPGNS